MRKYKDMSREELLIEKKSLEKQFEAGKAKRLKLDMSRGKPSRQQLELSNGMMNVLNSDAYFKDETGTDCRNYGILTGIPEAKRLRERPLCRQTDAARSRSPLEAVG